MHRDPHALSTALQGIMDILDAEGMAYLVNQIRDASERRGRSEAGDRGKYGETWHDLLRLLVRLLKDWLGI